MTQTARDEEMDVMDRIKRMEEEHEVSAGKRFGAASDRLRQDQGAAEVSKPSPALSIEEEHDNVRELPPKQATDPMEYWLIQRGRADEEISILTGQVRIAEQHIRQAEADKAEKLKLLDDACAERARCVAEIRRLEDEAAKPKV